MLIQFKEQVVLGLHVYGAGEVADLDDRLARLVLSRGHAVEHVQPPAAREAVARQQTRKAVRKGS